MKEFGQIWVLPVFFCCTLHVAYAQIAPNVVPEDESAEVFLEEYTDEFQNTFFEALKQKGIQNYDRAINLLLKCKKLDRTNKAVLHELSKTYYLNKQYIPAKEYALEALLATPDNYWFLAQLLTVLKAQNMPFESVQNRLPLQEESLKANLALYYFRSAQYQEAKLVLSEMNRTTEQELLLQRINDSINKEDIDAAPTKIAKETTIPATTDTALENYQTELKQLLAQNAVEDLEKKSEEALELYPLQPLFYYYKGKALHAKNAYKQAVEVLEEGLGYVFDDDETENLFYMALAESYKSLGDSSKSNSYLSKVKPGFQ